MPMVMVIRHPFQRLDEWRAISGVAVVAERAVVGCEAENNPVGFHDKPGKPVSRTSQLFHDHYSASNDSWSSYKKIRRCSAILALDLIAEWPQEFLHGLKRFLRGALDGQNRVLGLENQCRAAQHL